MLRRLQLGKNVDKRFYLIIFPVERLIFELEDKILSVSDGLTQQIIITASLLEKRDIMKERGRYIQKAV